MNAHWDNLCKIAREALSLGNYSYSEITWTAALQEAEDFAPTDGRLIETLDGLVEAFRRQGKFRQAENSARRLLEISNQVYGSSHIKSASASHNLAILYHLQQKYGQAEPLYKHALSIKTKELGPNAAEVSQILYSYADLLKKTHRDAEADNLIKCAEASVVEKNGSKVKKNAAGLAALPVWTRVESESRAAAKAPLAVPLMASLASSVRPQESVRANEAILSGKELAEHLFPGTTAAPAEVTSSSLGSSSGSSSINNLVSRQGVEKTWEELQAEAEEALAAGQLPRALEIWQQAVLIAEKYPPNDSRLARSLDRIGELLYRSEKFGQAEISWRQSLQIKEGVLGNFHPAIAFTTQNLAKLHYLLGRYTEAESYAQRSRKVYERCLGPQHPNVATCMHNLASLYHVQGRYAEAEEQYRSALKIRTKVLGLQNPETLSLTKSYADLLKILGREAEAQNLNSTANGFVSGSWKAIVIPENQALALGDDICMFCGAELKDLSACSSCQTRRGMPF
jgi:tetratricopeptide (TPR) repeat protein